MALDPSGDLFVADHGIQAVTEYAPDASGNATPIATITGPATGLGFPGGVALNSSGDLFVANGTVNPSQASVTEYAPGASGNATPIATIPSSSFGGANPADVAIDPSGDLYVTATSDQAVFEFAPGASGDATPIATLTGASTGLSGPADLALNSTGNLDIANSSVGTITTYPAGASGNVSPTSTLNVGQADGIGVSPSGDLYSTFTGETQGVNVYAPGATGNATPVATIAGANTALSDPAGVLIAPSPAARLAFVTDPSSGSAGKVLSSQPAVAIEDSSGTIVKTDTSPVSLSLTTVSGDPVGSLNCTANPVAAAAGVAAFAGCAVNEPGATRLGGTYLLRATDGTLTSASSVAFTISAPAPPVIDLAWSTDPVAEAGTLSAGQKVALTVTADQGGHKVPGAVVYLSLTRDGAAAGHPDNAKADCGTTVLPAYCQANTHGQVQVTYQSATSAGSGSDTLTAALDPYGTDRVTDEYTYLAPSSAKVASLSWNHSPVAPAASLTRGQKVKVSLAALAANGSPIPGAKVDVALTRAPGGDATVSGTGCTGNSTGVRCTTGATGHLTLTYTSSRIQPAGGSDALEATPPGAKSPAALVTYTYSTVNGLTWSTDPIAEAGSLSAGNKVPLTLTVQRGTQALPEAMVYLSLKRAAGASGQPDNATAECGTTSLPAYCQANAHGQVQVTYRTATMAGRGSDILTAALDPYGTGQHTDEYTYLAPSSASVTSLSWNPSPIARAGGLTPGKQVKVSLAALDSDGAPVARAKVDVTLIRAPGSDATLAGCSGLACRTDATGHLTLNYTSSHIQPTGGSDALEATTSPSGSQSPVAVDTYTYNNGMIDRLTWSTDPITEAGTLGAGQKVPLTLTVHGQAGLVRGSLVYLSLTRADVTPGHPDNARATCGTTALPAYCTVNASDQVQVTYQSATTAGSGSDTLSAALDPYGTDQVTDVYTYPAASTAKVASLSWQPSPVGPAGDLAPGQKVTLSLAPLAADGAPVPKAAVDVTLTRAPDSEATVSGAGCSAAGNELKCHTDATGHITLTYTSSGVQPAGGSDALAATASPPGPKSPTASDTYSYLVASPSGLATG
jgi:sugar lactone lactonase YvrE